ncbi:MAG: hypothetical protein K6G80_06210 [Treponema sp.]|nr:hypothetical protein [Treponema sp.]
MKHLVFDRNGKTFSLTGSVITVFAYDGKKLEQWFYADFETAKQAFLEMESLAA